MRLLIALSALGLLGLSNAQNTTNVTQIMVGGSNTADLFIFTPANVTANEGDVIMFTFSGQPGNHSVTQSSFNDPCDPLGNGFDSGNINIPMGTTSGFPSWNITITDASEPIWFFCKQLVPQTHCEAGMVGAINAPASGTMTFDAYVQNAENHQGPSGQEIGFLVGQGASASAVPGPLTGAISGFGLPNPSATAPATVASSAASLTYHPRYVSVLFASLLLGIELA